MDIQQAINKLNNSAVLGIAIAADGGEKVFTHRGIADLYQLVSNEPNSIRGGILIDKVVGKGAAMLAVKSGVAEVYAELTSESAVGSLNGNGVKVEYVNKQPFIFNRDHTGMCPVESIVKDIENVNDAYAAIGDFLSSKVYLRKKVTLNE